MALKIVCQYHMGLYVGFNDDNDSSKLIPITLDFPDMVLGTLSFNIGSAVKIWKSTSKGPGDQIANLGYYLTSNEMSNLYVEGTGSTSTIIVNYNYGNVNIMDSIFVTVSSLPIQDEIVLKYDRKNNQVVAPQQISGRFAYCTRVKLTIPNDVKAYVRRAGFVEIPNGKILDSTQGDALIHPQNPLYLQGFGPSSSYQDKILKFESMDRYSDRILYTRESKITVIDAFLNIDNLAFDEHLNPGLVMGVNDLVKIGLYTNIKKGTLKLTYGSSVKVWTSKNRESNTYIASGKIWDFDTETVPEDVYIEGTSGGATNLTLTYTFTHQVIEDTLLVTVLNTKKPRWQEHLWNNDNVQYKTNCYAYALDWSGGITYGSNIGYQFSGTPANPYRPQPGECSSYTTVATFDPTKFTFEDSEVRAIINTITGGQIITIRKDDINDYLADNNQVAFALFGALLDATANGHEFRQATPAEIVGNGLKAGQWVVYLVTTDPDLTPITNRDYHWYRQNFNVNGVFDGTWSHKPGNWPAINQEPIYDKDSFNDRGTYRCIGGTIYNPTTTGARKTIYRYLTTNNPDEFGTNYTKVVGAYVVGIK